MTLQLHQPDGEGGLVTRDDAPGDWRTELQSERWHAAKLDNPEMNPTRTSVAVLFWAGLGILTFVLLLVGYGTHFWK
jgi:hypothetical protein